MLSVVPWVKMISSHAAALTKVRIFSRRFVQIGRLIAEPMNATVYIGVVLFVYVDNGLNHLPRTLRGGGVVEINQWFAVGPSRGEDRKIFAEANHVEWLQLKHFSLRITRI